MESRKYPDRPIIGVGVCLLAEDSILLVKRANPPLVGAWSLPGGTQKLGETVKECGVREIKEETGLDIVITETIDVIDSIHVDNDEAILYHFTLIDYMGKVMSGKLAPGDDALDVLVQLLGVLAILGVAEHALQGDYVGAHVIQDLNTKKVWYHSNIDHRY